MRVRVADGSSIVGDQERNALWSDREFLDFGELDVALLGCDTMSDEATLGVIQKSECFVGLLNRDDI